jgi:hypothetical protein
VDAQTRRIVGWIVVAVGLAIAVLGGLADQIGLGGDGPDEFGGKQVAALIVGLVIAAAGLALALLSKGETEPSGGVS